MDLNKKLSSISTASKFILLWTPFFSFIIFNFFPLLFPELISNLNSNFWPATLIVLTILLKCWFQILLPGLWSLFMIYFFPPIKEIFLHRCIDLQFKAIRNYFYCPVAIICLYWVLIRCGMNEEIRNVSAYLIIICFIFSLFIYYQQSKRQLPAYISHKTFFLKKGAYILLTVNIFYLSISITIYILALLIEECVIPFAPIKNQPSLEFICFFALLSLFTIPSQCLLIAFTRKSKDTYMWLFNAIFVMLCIFFLYIEWSSSILKPELKRHHYAFFNDTTYYFDKPSCLIFKQKNITIEYLDEKLCFVKEKFETTSAIGKDLILTFKNNQRIVIPKPHYYSQSLAPKQKKITMT